MHYAALLIAAIACIAISVHSPLAAAAAIPTSSSGTLFTVWAPHAQSVTVQPAANVPRPATWPATSMAITNSSRPGVWTATVPNVQPGDAYVFAITPTATTAASSAPLLRVDPNGLEITDDGLASIVPQPYVFRNPRLLPPPLPQAIIYELHVPSFTADGTFQAAEAQLPHLAALGVTTIELMPIAYNGPAATSAGQWGYGPWTALAVRPSLGGWRGLQHFVDAAAGHNLSVLVDVVLNHESQQTLLKNFDGWSGGANGIYFYPPGTAAQTPWGPRPAFGSPPVAQYLLNTLNTLMEQAHIGGFRWDSTSCIRMSGDSSGGSCSQNNPDGWALLRAGADSARAQSALSIAEDTWGTPEPRIVSRADHGAGFDAVWGYSTFHFPAVDEITQADDSQIAVATVASACVAGSALLDPQHTIIFTENHDVSSNQHAGRIPQRVDPSNSTVAGSLYWAEKKSLLLLGLLMTCPGTPMLLQGQELLTFDSFDFPNPPKLDWSRAASYSGFLGAVQQLGQLRRVEAALSGGDARVLSTTDTDDDKILVFARTAAGAAPIVVVANMRKHTYVGSSAVALTNMPVDGVWSVRFSSDNASISPLFDGACSGPGNTTVHISGGAGALCVPPMAVLILEHQGVLAHEGAPLAEAPRPPVRDDKVVRLMIFAGEGTGGPNSSPRLRLEAADAEGLIRVAITPALNASEVESQLSTDNFDAILFPGGSGSHEADGLTEAGRQRVRDFVAAGGGYVGICAGGYLATANFSWSLDFINAGVKEPWDRGDGNVTIELSDEGRKLLQLEDYPSNLTIYYGQGPILQPLHRPDLPPFTRLATYTSEIHSKHTNETKGQMIGAPAVVVAEHGQGRVLVSSPHPELTSPPLDKMLAHYVLYVTKRI